MRSIEAIILMGPPGSGKSFLGNRLHQQGVAAYLELEPILVEQFGTGPEFVQNKGKAVAFIRQSYFEQIANRSQVVTFESTGVTDRPLLEDLQRFHSIALVKVATPKPICLQRIGSRASGKNFSNDLATSERFYDYWYSEIEPSYTFALEVGGEDVEQATHTIRQFLSVQGSLMLNNVPEMTADAVVEIVQLFNENDIEFYIDGGWGVDALLREQTRTHADLDIAVPHKDVAQIRALLKARGYSDVPRDDTWECNFVLGDNEGRQIDIHSYTFDSSGNHVYGVAYPLDSLAGDGSVNGHSVKCISPEWLVKFHTGYNLDENDYRDVKALCQRFGIPIPAEYDGFETP